VHWRAMQLASVRFVDGFLESTGTGWQTTTWGWKRQSALEGLFTLLSRFLAIRPLTNLASMLE
jgi:hypothetical protein